MPARAPCGSARRRQAGVLHQGRPGSSRSTRWSRSSRPTTRTPSTATPTSGRAAELVNGTLLKPGEEFSLNEVVGERTAENGFTKGFIISDGVFKEDLGGGVSQVATTTFNAMFFAGLEDVEHKPHSFYIDRYPVGREATVAWPTRRPSVPERHPVRDPRPGLQHPEHAVPVRGDDRADVVDEVLGHQGRHSPDRYNETVAGDPPLWRATTASPHRLRRLRRRRLPVVLQARGRRAGQAGRRSTPRTPIRHGDLRRVVADGAADYHGL